jgi:hypothetical protein
MTMSTSKGIGYYMAYFLDVSPLTVINPWGTKYHAYLYKSHHRSEIIETMFDSINFKFSLSPVTTVFSYSFMSTFDFLVNICAISGGFLTLCSILNSVFAKLSSYNNQDS